jgi:hypothetical protein
VNNTQSPPPYDNTPPTLDGVKEPNNWGRAWFYGLTTVYRLHINAIEGHTEVRSIYQRGRIELHTLEEEPELLGLINIGYIEVNTLLQHIQLRQVCTWIPHRELPRIVIAKVLRTTVPEVFGHTLPQPNYRVLCEEEYIRREKYHDCTCGCNN